MKKISLTFLAILFALSIYAEERQVLTSDSVKLYVNVKGKGTPCLYIHGGPGSGSFWLEKFFGDYLEQHFQMIYLDQRGVCRSSSPEDHNYSLDRFIKDFEEVRVALGIKQWITLGHSFGGILQMAYAESCPQSNIGMIMINCTLSMKRSFCESWLPKASEFLGIENRSSDVNDSIPLTDQWMALIGKLNEKGLMWKMAYASQENDRLMNATYGEVPHWNNDFSSVALTIDDYWKDFRKNTPDIKIPVLFFYGRTDWMVGPEHYKGVKFPDMILWGSDVGHMPFLENKTDLERAINSYAAKYKF